MEEVLHAVAEFIDEAVPTGRAIAFLKVWQKPILDTFSGYRFKKDLQEMRAGTGSSWNWLRVSQSLQHNVT